jgi:hypothetical protein
MTRRVVAVVVPAAVPGISDELRLAMVEDTYETVAALELVEPALVVRADDPLCDAVAGLTWAGTAVHTLPSGTPMPVAGQALRLLAATGADQVTLVSGDAPDLPGLLIGKLHRALGSADVAVLPSATGGLVALAVRAPLPPWLPDEGVDLDRVDAIALLQAGAPRRTAVSVGPGWHRVRAADDLGRLDPGLEGWDVTRALMRR